MDVRADLHTPWAARLNLRDVGGCTTRVGALVPLRRIYRSGELSNLDRETACVVREQLGMATIVDLRTSGELAHSGLGPVAALAGVRHRHIPLFESIEPEWEAPVDQSPHAVANRYHDMAEAGGAAMTRLLRVLTVRENYPVLIHCAVGRDRTGIVIAILLDLLDIPRPLTAKDYARSAEAVHVDGASALSATMDLFLEKLTLLHGSARDFLLRHGATADALGAFRDALMTES